MSGKRQADERIVDGRRVRAAVAYSDLNATEIAGQLDVVSPRTFGRWTQDGIPRRYRYALAPLARLCDLPEAFFYVDFGRLGELVRAGDGKPVATGPGPDRAGTAEALQAVGEGEQPGEDQRPAPRHRKTGS
jgi:hypothetical protein